MNTDSTSQSLKFIWQLYSFCHCLVTGTPNSYKKVLDNISLPSILSALLVDEFKYILECFIDIFISK